MSRKIIVPIVVFDTSCLITAVCSQGWNFTHDLIDLLELGGIRAVTSSEALFEFETALQYDHIFERINPKHKLNFLQIYRQNLEIIDIPKAITEETKGGTTDPKDDMFLAICQHAKADYLASLDRGHLLKLEHWKNTKITRPIAVITEIAKLHGFENPQDQLVQDWWQEIKQDLFQKILT